MPNDIDEQIRGKQRELIIASYATAKVWPYNALSHQLSEWPGMFRVSSSVTHGWIIKRAKVDAEWKNVPRDRRFMEYDVWGFYGFRTGKIGDNSDDEFAEICDTIYLAYKAAPTLNFDGTVEKHDLLQFSRITTINCGEETLHFAQGRINVRLCC